MGLYKRLKEKAKTMPFIIAFMLCIIFFFFPKDTVNKKCFGFEILREVTRNETGIQINTTCFGIPYNR